jgi:hypothetical protein
MGRPAGTKNKRTRIFEQNAQIANAAAQLSGGNADPHALVESLAVMDEAMKFFVKLARAEKADKPESIKAKGDYYLAAAGIAEKIAPYRHPRLSAMKVAADRTNMPNIPDDLTAQELRAEILSNVIRLGVLPLELTTLLPEPQQLLEPGDVVLRGHNGSGRE